MSLLLRNSNFAVTEVDWPQILLKFIVAITIACAASGLAASSTSAVCNLDVIFEDGLDVPATFDLSAPGPFTVATLSGTSTNNSRVTPWVASYPVGAVAAPVVFFIPGFQLASSLYQGWNAHLASWGYVAVRTDPPAGLLSLNEPAMALDVSNVITDIFKPAAVPVTLDNSKVAVAGHGIGGKVAFLVAASDGRVRAVFTFDPINDAGTSGYTSNQPSIIPQPVGDVNVPSGILGELVDSAPVSTGPPCNPASTNYQTIFTAEGSSPAAYEWTLAGSSYTSFVPDQAACGLSCTLCKSPTLSPADTYVFMRSSAIAFLRTHLEGAPRLCPWLSGKKIPTFVTTRESSKP